VIQAEQAEIIEPDEAEFLEVISLYPAPEYSICQMAVCLTSGGKETLFGGDVMHHPIQIYHPEWNSVYCEDTPQARASWRWALDYLADRHALFQFPFRRNLSGACNPHRRPLYVAVLLTVQEFLLRCQDLINSLCRDLLKLIFKRAEIATEQEKELNKE
jgi:hypothetical protein